MKIRFEGASARAGVSMVELIVALTVFGVLIAASLGFMSSQYRAFQGGVDRMSSLQTGRFALQALEEDMRTLGTNVPGGQPTVAVAGTSVVAFMSDYVTNIANDPFGVFYNPDAPTGEVSAPTGPVSIPNTAMQFPDTTYFSGGVISPAEMLIFYFSLDATTTRSDDYVLYRKVNAATPEIVARNLLAPSGLPFFRYMKAGPIRMDSIADNLLPKEHTVKVHKSKADSGQASLVDSIRGIRVSLRATNGLTGANERIVELTRIIPLVNSENSVLKACGSVPLLGSALAASLGTTPSGEPAVNLAWTRATDEAMGELDVIRYVIWRRELPAGFTDPYLSIPAGQVNYTYQDAAVERLATYQYGLAAQDCTPSLSTRTNSLTVTIP
jgi:prepilin-type N-terminal cleavage/methylation domain-containing protein